MWDGISVLQLRFSLLLVEGNGGYGGLGYAAELTATMLSSDSVLIHSTVTLGVQRLD